MGDLTFRLIFYNGESGNVVGSLSEKTQKTLIMRLCRKFRESEIDLIMRAVQVVKFLEKSCAESCAERCSGWKSAVQKRFSSEKVHQKLRESPPRRVGV